MEELVGFKEKLNSGRWGMGYDKLFNATRYEVVDESDQAHGNIVHRRHYIMYPIDEMRQLLSAPVAGMKEWDIRRREEVLRHSGNRSPTELLNDLGKLVTFLEGADCKSVDADRARKFHLDYAGLPLGRHYERSCLVCGVPSGRVAVLDNMIYGDNIHDVRGGFFVFNSEADAPAYNFSFRLKPEFVRKEMMKYSKEFSEAAKMTREKTQSFLEDLCDVEDLVRLKAEEGDTKIPEFSKSVGFKPPRMEWHLLHFSRSKEINLCDKCFGEESDIQALGRSVYDKMGFGRANDDVPIECVEFSLRGV